MEQNNVEISPLTDEELAALVARMEEENDYESELSRTLFTLLVTVREYETLYITLQAYYAAGSASCFDVAQAAAKVIGLRDKKKIDTMTKIAAEFAGNIPNRAMDLLKAQGFLGDDIDQEAGDE